MITQTTQKELTSTTSLEWSARQRIIVNSSLVVSGIGTALILGVFIALFVESLNIIGT